MTDENISVLMDEKRVFKPTKEFVNNTNVKQWMDKHNIKTLDDLYKKADNWEWFWDEMAKELVEFYTPPKKTVEWEVPGVKWFVGAKYNIVHDAIDKHVKTWRKNEVAFIFEGEPGDVRKLTYNDLYIEVNKLANALRKMGIKKGDRVGVYLPMIPELPIAMLACAKIGAIHSVVFSGFSASAFRDRMLDCEAKAVITCDSFWRRGKKVPLKNQTDAAVKEAPSVQHVIVYKRTGDDVNWDQNKDFWWHDIKRASVSGDNLRLIAIFDSGDLGRPRGLSILAAVRAPKIFGRTSLAGRAFAIIAAVHSGFVRLVFLDLGCFFITFHLALVGLSQTDDPRLAVAWREHHAMQPIFDEAEHAVATFSIIFTLVFPDQGGCPFELLGKVQ